MSADPPTPDEVWKLITATVMDTRDGWKRAVAERTGLPFSRVRVLRRLHAGPLSVKQLAHAAAMDAPAATVAVNDLEERGLVVRECDPNDRRTKLVSITPAGRAAVERAMTTPDPAPEAVRALTSDDLSTLAAILRKLH
ncbi:MarR family winged helix-turn-helix transcriptional regulator [Nocardia stercoris]|uniref:MarR family transcriptional regulator n=1 Tax=Nocardia stercoris TaxID=2483361 RepID=A0A3M2LL86_9NOCA|nr:MarR family transcriptional regulator [Nocardia stercoris]RMI35588.1 MarR family transcriptional regulator [Nocardia stercoris]